MRASSLGTVLFECSLHQTTRFAEFLSIAHGKNLLLITDDLTQIFARTIVQ